MLLKPNEFLNNPFKTRDDVERGCRALLDPLEPHTSPLGALVDLAHSATHYDLRAVALEGFARPLWGVASLLAGGGDYPAAERWVRGLAAGTDPSGPEYWGGAQAKDQRMVEMSPLSFAIAMQPDVFYNSQSEQTKLNIAAFLETCIGKPMPDTNWLWFRVFANLALRNIGSDLFNPGQMEKDLLRLEEFQLAPNPATGTAESSSGWSRDGPEGVMQLDYYSGSFAIHTSQLIYAKLAADSDPARAIKYRERAQEYVKDLIYYFDNDGNGIPFGRSMIYRFAIIATFSCLALADVPPPAPFEWGHIKGLVLRHLRSWSKSSEWLRSDGTLTIGYKYENLNMAENYNAPGSPYWAMKAFTCLAAPPSHPFWTSTELPLPNLPTIKALPDPGHIMCRSGGHVFLLSSGQSAHYALRHAGAKYGKFAYSSTFGFNCSTGDLDLSQVAADSMIALKDISPLTLGADGETWRVRRFPLDARVVGRGTGNVHLHSSWKPWGNVTVDTWLIPPQESSPNWYLRVHRIKTDRVLASAEAGWATYGQGPDGRALMQEFSGNKSAGGEEEKGWARASTSGGCVGVWDVSVRAEENNSAREGKLVQSDPNANIIFSRSILPTLMGEVQGEQWIATAVFGAPPGVKWEKEWERRPSVPDYVFA